MDATWGIAAGVLGLVVGAAAYWIRVRVSVGGVSAEADRIVRQAETDKERLLRGAEVEARESLLAMQQDHEREVAREREEIAAREKRLRSRETGAEQRNTELDQRERELKDLETSIEEERRRAEDLERESKDKLQQARTDLERVAGLSREQAREEIVAAMEEEARRAAAAQIERIEAEAKREADDRAARIIAGAIQRQAGGFVAEKTVSVVELPSDDMKGRIIGREGRNIRAIEAATGVDVIIDDTPEVVVLSAFNPERREVARLALERLIADGRIHPARIEEVVEQATAELQEGVQKAGEQATFDLGLHGLHPELVKLVGGLRHRMVNGQNLWDHSVETATIGGIMAAELGTDQNLAKRAGLLHDVGRAINHEVEGAHAEVAAEHIRRFGEKPEIVAAIRHHHDEQPPTLLSAVLQAADVLSKSRPGARRDLLESYIKRLEDLERISLSFPGVDRAWAMQAGREVRVMVNYGEVNDQEALLLSGDIARRIEDELTYPGEVKVTVIREARATEIAR